MKKQMSYIDSVHRDGRLWNIAMMILLSKYGASGDAAIVSLTKSTGTTASTRCSISNSITFHLIHSIISIILSEMVLSLWMMKAYHRPDICAMHTCQMIHQRH